MHEERLTEFLWNQRSASFPIQGWLWKGQQWRRQCLIHQDGSIVAERKIVLGKNGQSENHMQFDEKNGEIQFNGGNGSLLGGIVKGLFPLLHFHKYGHRKKECWYESNNRENFQKEKVDDETWTQKNCLFLASLPQQICLVLGSGCSNHIMTGDKMVLVITWWIYIISGLHGSNRKV